MENSIPALNKRIRLVRHTLNLSQVQFSKIIPISSSYIAGMELGKRKANDRIIKLICTSFNVNEQWLRHGEGEMFSENHGEAYIKLVSLYRDLNPVFQDYILKQIELLLEIQVKK